MKRLATFFSFPLFVQTDEMFSSSFRGFAVLVIWQDAVFLIYFKWKNSAYAQFFQNWTAEKT